MQVNWKLVVPTAVFAVCEAPTFVSYASYTFGWDDAEYLWRSMAASNAFWFGHRHDLINAIGSHGPIMSLLGLPWGPLHSWDGAGECFLTHAALTGFFVALCLFLLLRVSLKPQYLVVASACVFAALGPYLTATTVRVDAAGFATDSLFAWIVFAAVLLIPYEATTRNSSDADAIVRGFLWGIIFSVGLLTKVSSLFFVGLVVPVVLVIRLRNSGLRAALVSLTSLAVCSSFVAAYWFLYGRTAWDYGWSSSFGPIAKLYAVPLPDFLGITLRESPGMLLPVLFVMAAVTYSIIRWREIEWKTNLLPILIMTAYCMICLASRNREIRFSFPGIIALPFLFAILVSGKTPSFPSRTTAIAAIFVFFYQVVAAVPTLHRPNRKSIALSEAILAQAYESNAKDILLATDSSSLNYSLMRLAIAVSPSRSTFHTANLAWRAADGSPMEKDFRDIRQADLVVFQNKEDLDSPITNMRLSEYEQFALQYFGEVPLSEVDGVRIYGARSKQH
jgi:hypothetical protein